jgi:hypothetical protein
MWKLFHDNLAKLSPQSPKYNPNDTINLNFEPKNKTLKKAHKNNQQETYKITKIKTINERRRRKQLKQTERKEKDLTKHF